MRAKKAPINALRSWAVCLAFTLSPLAPACDDDDGGGTTPVCPEGPASPLGAPCEADQEGLECRYGYDPPECGGRTVLCREGLWTEVEHSDPLPQCFDAGAGDDVGGAAEVGVDAESDSIFSDLP